MDRSKIPRAPRPDGTPSPTSRLDAEQRGMNANSWESFIYMKAHTLIEVMIQANSTDSATESEINQEIVFQ